MARAIPTTSYEWPGTPIAVSIWDSGPKALNDFLANRPTFHSQCQNATSVADNVWTAIPYVFDLIDTDGGHNTVVNNTKYFCQVPGWYWVKGSVAWNSTGTNTASRFEAGIAVNANIIVGSSQFLFRGTNDAAAMSTSALLFLNAGDYVEIWCRQHTGAAQLLDNNSSGTEPDFNLFWVSS